ncbi:MAG: ester cyclase [Streptosporangiaceae bacterium]
MTDSERIQDELLRRAGTDPVGLAPYQPRQGVVRWLFAQGMNERKAEIFTECVAPDFVNHDLPGPAPGPEGLFQSFAMFEAAFPDLQVHLEEVLAAEDDKVITRSHWTGTHRANHGRASFERTG